MTELVLSPQCRLTKTCLILDPKTTEREWLTIGKTLKTVEKSLQFWVGDWVLFGAERWFIDSDRYDNAEEATGFEHSTLKVFASVAKNVAPLVRTNALSFQHHQLVAPLEPDNQKKWLDLAVENGWSTRQLRDEIRDANKKEVPLPEGTYEILLADPPWFYSNSGFTQSAAAQYETMPTEEICALPVGPLGAPDSTLFLWATSPLLPEALEVMKSWDYTYKMHFIWFKDRAPGIGCWARTVHELLLVGARGKHCPDEDNKVETVIEAKVGAHSAKPDIFYEVVQQMYPYAARKLELFARRPYPGWSAWGNEILNEAQQAA